MSVSDSTSGLSLKDVLANSSVKTSTTSSDSLAAAASQRLHRQPVVGQGRVPAVAGDAAENQNPLDPQDNSAFVAQLAQFSSLEGITTLNDTVSGIAGNYNSSQALQASSLVGRSVVAQTDTAVVDTSKSFNGTAVVTCLDESGDDQDH